MDMIMIMIKQNLHGVDEEGRGEVIILDSSIRMRISMRAYASLTLIEGIRRETSPNTSPASLKSRCLSSSIVGKRPEYPAVNLAWTRLNCHGELLDGMAHLS